MLSSVFNAVYVILVTVSLIATAEIFRKRRRAPIRSTYVVVLYAVLVLSLPVVFLFGYAGGGSIGLAISTLVSGQNGETSRIVTTIGAVVGIYIGSYLLGLFGVVVGSLLANLAEKLQEKIRQH